MKFEINMPDYHGERWVEYDETDAEEAAEAFARSYNEDGDYTLMNSERMVRVRNPEDGSITVWSISAEPAITYSTWEVNNWTCKNCRKSLMKGFVDGSLKPYRDEFCDYECYKKYYAPKEPVSE